MDEQGPMTAKAMALFEAYAALNRSDISGFIKDFDTQVERVEPADLPGGGTYRGLEAVKEHFLTARGSWAEGSCEPQRYVVSGDKVIVFVHVHVRLKNESEFREGQIGDVFTFRNGKVIQFRTFCDSQQALEWAEATLRGSN